VIFDSIWVERKMVDSGEADRSKRETTRSANRSQNRSREKRWTARPTYQIPSICLPVNGKLNALASPLERSYT
jgi:hypothetical protein